MLSANSKKLMCGVPVLGIFENREKINCQPSAFFFSFWTMAWFYVFITLRLLDLEPGCSFWDAVSLQFRERISVAGYVVVVFFP